MIKAMFVDDYILTESSNESKDLSFRSQFGELLKNGQVKISLIEALYLVYSEKIELFSGKKKVLFEELLKKVSKIEKNTFARFYVFKDLRDKGYIVKTALKFGADFRVYEKGIKPGEDHSKWVVYPVKEAGQFSWQEFSAKNRVAHSTKKMLMVGIVDDEGDVTYYEIKWMRT